jgi:glycosyltransferase involved in cell wall biosynthesis
VGTRRCGIMSPVGLRLLHVVHDFLPRHRAGVEVYVSALATELARRHHVTVLTSDYDPARAHGEVIWRVYDDLPVVELVNNWEHASFAESYSSPLVNRRIEQVLEATRPDVIHLHSLLNFSFDLPAIASRMGIPVVATLHDYTLVCPSGGQRLHRAEAHICDEIEPERCARCVPDSVFGTKLAVGGLTQAAGAPLMLRRAAGYARAHAPALARLAQRAAKGRALQPSADNITTRLAAARRAMAGISLFVAPSQFMARAFTALGAPAGRVTVSDYGMPPLTRSSGRAASGGPLRVGFVGSLVPHKGAHVLVEAMRQLPPGDALLTIFGNPQVDPGYAAQLQDRAAGAPVAFGSAFDDAARADVYAALDLLAVPSLWLENSPLVIHEAFQAGIPVVGSDIGGIPELVINNVNGLIVPPGSAADLAGAVRRLADDRQLLARLASQVSAVKSIAEDAAEWEARYHRSLGCR